MTRFAYLATILLAATLLNGCSKRSCEPGELPTAFERVKDELPSEMFVCKGRTSPKLPDRTMHVNYKVDTAHDAWMTTVKHFMDRGWKRTSQNTEKHSLRATFKRDGTTLEFEFSERGESDVVKRMFESPEVRGYVMIR